MTDSASHFAAGCVVSLDPLVTISKREPHLPMGLAPANPELFADRAALHLVGLTWHCEHPDIVREIVRDYAAACTALPKSEIVVLANTAKEARLLSQEGIPNLLMNELIFIDERRFAVLPPQPSNLMHFDAIYVAKLDPGKRHELAAAIPSLVLTQGPPKPAEVERVKALLPKARFANFEAYGGAYGYLPEEDLVSLMNRAAVGLCLSSAEGSMRVSMEYRLCGTPVVSTHSTGGRDRYFVGPHVRVVDDSADAVAAAARELKGQRLNRQAVRDFVGQLVAFDRHQALRGINKLVERRFGMPDRFKSFAPFAHYPVSWRKPVAILAPLRR